MGGLNLQWSAVTDNWHQLVSGLWLTIIYTVLSSVLGMAWGTILAMGRVSVRGWVRAPATGVLELVRGVPLLVLLIWFYYAFPLLTGLSISAPVAATIALSLYASSYYGEIVRGGILSIDAGQIDAALSLGMTYGERMRRVILPQAFRRMVPPLTNQTIINLKNTSLASVVTIGEITYQAEDISAKTYRPIEVYTAAAVLYLILVIPTSILARRLELKNKRTGAYTQSRGKSVKPKVGVAG